jgi:hypothetical protein
MIHADAHIATVKTLLRMIAILIMIGQQIILYAKIVIHHGLKSLRSLELVI